MKGKAFTFIEILLVLIVVGTLTTLGLSGFKHSRDAHRVDTLLQELTVLRTAILAYKEMHGKLPEIEESELSSDNFNALKPFWYPFHPESSKILEGGKWWGMLHGEQSYLAVKQCDSYVTFDTDILDKKMQKLCYVDDTGTHFYILASYGCSPVAPAMEPEIELEPPAVEP